MKNRLTNYLFVLIVILLTGRIINAQSIPQQTVPVNGSTWETTTPNLSWLLYNNNSQVNFSVQVSLSQNNFSNPYLVVNAAATAGGVGSYSIPSGLLAVGVTYYWRIGYNGNYSTVWSFTPSTGSSGPTPIVILPTSLISPQDSTINVSLSPTFNWNSVNGATNYQIQISTNANFSNIVTDASNITTTTYSAAGFSFGGAYYWRVRALNNIGASNWSNSFIFFTQPPLPSAPTLLQPADGSANLLNSINFSWSHSQYDSVYTIQLSIDPDFNSIADSIHTTQNSAAIGGLIYNQTYFWRVNSTNFTGTGNWSSVFSFKTKPQPPFAPTLLFPVNPTVGPVNYAFMWSKGANSSGVNKFQFQISKSQSFSSNVISYNKVLDTTLFVSGLSPQTQYYWRVKAYSPADSSDWSATFNYATLGGQKTIYVDVNNGSDFAFNNIPAGDGSLLKPYKTINKALTQLGFSFGDTIRVANGIYPEILNINFPVIIIGSGNTQVAAINIGYNVGPPNPTYSVVIKNIEATFLPGIINPGSYPSSGINIQSFNNIWLDNVKVSNFNLGSMGIASLFVMYSNNLTVTNSDFSNNVHGILIFGSSNVTLTNVTANSNPTVNLGTLSPPVFGMYVDNTRNINFTDLTFDSNDIGLGLKNVNNGTITNLTITNSSWFNVTTQNSGALLIGSCSSLTFNGGRINQNKCEAVIVDPSNFSLNIMGVPLQVPVYPNQNSLSNSTDNLKFTGNYEFKNNTGGIFFASPGFSIYSSVTNSPLFDGSFVFSGNSFVGSGYWMGSDICITGRVNDLNVKGAQFINSVPYPSPNYIGPPTFSPATPKAIYITNFNDVGLTPIGSQPNGLIFNNCVFDQSVGGINSAIANLSPYNVNARSNDFAYASSQFDIESLIYDSLDTQFQPIKSGRVDYTGSVFGSKLPPTISIGSLPKSFRGASYYLPVNIVTKGNSYNVLQGKFSYDASKLHYNGYLSNASGLINQKQWTTLSVIDTVIHNVTPPDSGFIQFYAFGNAPIDSNGTLFKLNMQILPNAATPGSPGFTIIGSVNSNFLGNNQPVFVYNQSLINYYDPNGIVQAKGDVNLDGVVNMDDFMALLYHLLGTQIITDPTALANADFNSDSQVNQTDLNELFLFLNPSANIVSPAIVVGNISMPNISITQNSSVVIPVSIQNAKNVNSLEVILHYDPLKIKFQSFANNLKLADQYIHGFETEPGTAVYVVQSPHLIDGLFNPGSVTLRFENSNIPIGATVTSQYRLNGQELKDGPTFAFGNNGITAVETPKEIPTEFKLAQNYPNPFNPSTVINYSLPKNSLVTIKIYNLLGQEVKTLVSHEMSAGNYSVEWNGESNTGSRVASGIYIYRITAGAFTSSKKMIMLK